MPDLPELTESENLNGTVNTENSPVVTSNDAHKSKEAALRDLLDLPDPNSVRRDVNTESPPEAEAPGATQSQQPATDPLNLTDPPTPDQLINKNGPQDDLHTIINQRQGNTNNENRLNIETTSTNTESETPAAMNENQPSVSTTSTNNKTALNNEDMSDLRDAGLSPSGEKPIEKVYNEWLTTFSDDSLFDEMTEEMKSDNPSKSPEQTAAEGLLLLRNQSNHESNEILMPIDAPKLPDLVLEMDAEKQAATSSINNGKDDANGRMETDNVETTLIVDTPAQKNTKQTGSEKEIQNAPKAGTTKSPTKGVFQMRTIGLRKHKSPTHRIVKKIGCSMCSEKFENRNDLKTHHQQDHKILTCNTCGKHFSTKKSLSKHAYKHSELPWKCKKCGEGFAFPSELKAHLTKHETEPMFKCNLIGCKKEYMRQSELTAHLKTHDGTIHKCPEEGCVYEAIDIRYLKNHMQVHSDDLPYPCKYCDKSFKHFMQRKRHYMSEHS